MIYLIEEIWSDSMENDVSAALGYAPVGYVTDEEVAKKIVEDGGLVPVDYNWVTSSYNRVFKGMRYSKFKYKPIKEYGVQSSNEAKG
jgi:hypothetical protein